MNAPYKVVLGQEAFTLSSDGWVVRTKVAKIFASGQYLLLDGAAPQHWLSYEEAVAAAIGLVSAKERQLKQRLKTLQKMRKQLATDEACAAMMSRPFTIVDLSEGEYRARTRKLKRLSIPTQYPHPGTMVYIAVTPSIRTLRFDYRPHESFILEVPILSVWFTPDGTPHVALADPYGAKDYFPTRKEAMAAHPDISIVVSHEEFKEGEEEFEREHPVF